MSLNSPPPPPAPPPGPISGPSAATPNTNTSQFAPRREFIRDRHTFSTFALFALSGSSAIRLYSFPPGVIAAFKRFFHDSKTAVTFRHDAAHTMSEFTIEGRPWAMAKSITTEKLIVDLLAVVFRHGYVFLSTIDYGREQDDRLAVAFSKPSLHPGSRPGSPDPGLPLNGVLVPPPRTASVPFAISFSSATVLRVINPPLNSTPAILQAVRGSWPRGVVAEKKVAETCFEFKLKGYSWFQEDTFAQDSLHHILTLLAALDTHGFKLLSSITLASRSRIKDLWIFTGMSSEILPESPPGSPFGSSLELKRQDTAEGSGGSSHGHAMRGAPNQTTPMKAPPSAAGSGLVNGNAASDRPIYPASTPEKPPSIRSPSRLSNSPSQNNGFRSLLRKAPKVSSPPSGSTLRQEMVASHSQEPIVASLPSEVGSGVNMTGVGTVRQRDGSLEEEQEEGDEPDILYETDGERNYERSVTPALTQILSDEDPFRRGSPPPIPYGSSPHKGRPVTPPPLPPRPQPPPSVFGGSQTSRPIPLDQPRTPSPPHSIPPTTSHTSALLGSGVFRDTTFSGSTGWRSTGVDVPVTWFGPAGLDIRDSQLGKHDSGVGLVGDFRDRTHSTPGGASSLDVDLTSPRFPGAWSLTPVAERGASSSPATPQGTKASGYFPQRRAATPDSGARWAFPAPHQLERLDVEGRVSMPVLAEAGGAARQSEAALVGHMPVPSVPMPVPELLAPRQGPGHQHRRSASGDGWVLVDVEGAPPLPPRRARSGSDSLVPRASLSAAEAVAPRTLAQVSFAAHARDPRIASNQSLPVKESGTIRRLFTLNKEPGSGAGNRIRKARAPEVGRTFR